MSKFTPPAIPLVTVDPYFSIWSFSTHLHTEATKHWTGRNHEMIGLLAIDGYVWRFLDGSGVNKGNLINPAMKQCEVKVEPLTSRYTFEAAGVRLQVSFTTPLLLNDLDILSRPASYVTFEVQSIDGKEHDIKLYYDAAADLCVNEPQQLVEWSGQKLSDGSYAMKIGTAEQPLLARAGDNVRIDWGYAYLLVPEGTTASYHIGTSSARRYFSRHAELPQPQEERMPRAANDDPPVMAALIDFGSVAEESKSNYIVLAYDDILSVEYFHKRLPGYWRRNGMTAEEMLMASVKDYSMLMRKCEQENERVVRLAQQCGGDRYADLIALSYRQAIAAHKLVADEQGEVLFFSKENFSNGCMATVDVSYPSIPLFLLFNPELVKGMLRPIFAFTRTEAWSYPFAPHDVGCYPHANGQVYGKMALDRQMPVEECGNMLIMTAAVCLSEGNAEFAACYWDELTKWAKYLLENGLDPGNQLCTDDFAGHLAHNTNLSIKAIIGIGCYGLLCGMLGKDAEHDNFIGEAQRMALEWEKKAREGDHYRLAFDAENSWSLKYNLVWDNIFGLNLFPKEIARKEVAHYLKMRNRYGTPLDSRKPYTKADWLLWAATLAESRADFEAMIEPLWEFVCECEPKVPFSDWYFTDHGRVAGFVNRSVIGGLCIKMVADLGIDHHLKGK